MSTIKTAVLEELKPHKLTKVTGRKPTFDDVERWVEECSDIAARVKTDVFEGGQIPEEEYRLELEDGDWEYAEPSDPGPYHPEIDADTEEFVKSRLEAEHKRAQEDYKRYEAVKEHLQNEFQECMDEAWIIALRKPRSKYTTRTVKEFLDHLRNTAAKLTSKQRQQLRERIKFEWDQTKHITEYFTALEEMQLQIEGWLPDTNLDVEVVETAGAQMRDSGVFDKRFLREWEKKADEEKTWTNLKEYFTEEYQSIKDLDDEETPRALETLNNIQGERAGQEISEIVRDAMVNSEQLQQMSTAFTGATTTMSEVMDRLKAALDEIKVLNGTRSKLYQTTTKCWWRWSRLWEVMCQSRRKSKHRTHHAAHTARICTRNHLTSTAGSSKSREKRQLTTTLDGGRGRSWVRRNLRS